MSSFRQIHSKIWKDDWFLELEPVDKLFFIYLFSNESASLAGIYELAIRVMSFESGLTAPEIRDSFKLFMDARKAYYEDGVVWIPKLRKYHETKSPKVQTRIIKDVERLKPCNLKWAYCEAYGIDRVSVDLDRVSIPPYTSTSTITSPSASSLKGGMGGNGLYEGHIENTHSQELQDAITEICNVVKGESAMMPSDMLYALAASISDCKNDDMIPGFRAWWDRNGNYQGRPALKSFNLEWDNYIEGVERTGQASQEKNQHQHHDFIQQLKEDHANAKMDR